MTLSNADIQDVLKGVESAPPVSSALRRAAANVLAFPPKPDTGDILNKLDDMRMPQPLLDQLRKPFKDLGFSLAEDAVVVGYAAHIPRYYTTATREDVQLALLHLPPELLDDTRTWGSFADFIEPIEANVKLIAQGRQASPSFARFLNDSNEKRGRVWTFVSWEWLELMFRGESRIEDVFSLPKTVPAGSLTLVNLSNQDRKKIVGMLISQASQPGGLPAREALEHLILGASWPDGFRTALVWKGNADADAEAIVALAIRRGSFGAKEARPGDTYLGALVSTALSGLGEDRADFARMILRYRLVSRPDSLSEVRSYLSS